MGFLGDSFDFEVVLGAFDWVLGFRCGFGRPSVERNFEGRREVRGVIRADQSGERFAEGDSMMRSQTRASEGGELEIEFVDGYSAATQRKTCLVFQVKREVRSASKSNFMIAYSARLVE